MAAPGARKSGASARTGPTCRAVAQRDVSAPVNQRAAARSALLARRLGRGRTRPARRCRALRTRTRDCFHEGMAPARSFVTKGVLAIPAGHRVEITVFGL